MVEKIVAVSTIIGSCASIVQGGSPSQILASFAGISCGSILFAISMKGA